MPPATVDLGGERTNESPTENETLLVEKILKFC